MTITWSRREQRSYFVPSGSSRAAHAPCVMLYEEEDMTDHYKRFEVFILRPLQILFLASAIVFLVKSMWWGAAAGAACIFYLGIIGSKLHPLQSASDLAQGPLEGTKAQIESELLTPEMKRMLVGHACTRIGILLGVVAGVVSCAALGWRWYFALLIIWPTILLSGALMKLAFKTV